MTRRKIKFSNMKDIDAFNKLCSKFDCDMDLVSGKYYVNAKSIMFGSGFAVGTDCRHR